MALPTSSDVKKLDVTYFGSLSNPTSSNASIMTQDLGGTYFGKVAAGNDYGTGASPPASVNNFMAMLMFWAND